MVQSVATPQTQSPRHHLDTTVDHDPKVSTQTNNLSTAPRAFGGASCCTQSDVLNTPAALLIPIAKMMTNIVLSVRPVGSLSSLIKIIEPYVKKFKFSATVTHAKRSSLSANNLTTGARMNPATPSIAISTPACATTSLASIASALAVSSWVPGTKQLQPTTFY